MCGNENFCFNCRIKGEERTITKHYRVTAIMLCYIPVLLHKAIGGGEKLLLLGVIALGIEKLLLLLIVIALVTF